MGLLSRPEPVAAVLRRPHGLLEAPRLAEGRVVLYSDVTSGGVYSVSPGGEVSKVVPKRRGVGGLVEHCAGGVVFSGRTLLHRDGSGEDRELLAADDVAGFNDLSTTPEGDVLAGALRFNPFAGEDVVPGRLFRVTAPGEAVALSESLLWPNGIGLSPDGGRVYVSDYARRHVATMTVDGKQEEIFCDVPNGSADGLAVDVEGGVWVALGEGGAVARFTSQGDLDGICDVPAGFVSSLCFGGADGRDVLISTADNHITPDTGGALFSARSEVAGVPVTPAAV
jgi:sugar lactone lactonase YvrE